MFRKALEDYWNSKSEEEKEKYKERQEEKRRRILYSKDIDVKSASNIDPCSVILRIDSEDKLHLAIVDRRFKETGDREFWGYYFDKHFINRITNADPYGKFVLDMGSDIYINMKELQQVVDEMSCILFEMGIDVEDDYFPSIRPMLAGTIFE